MVPALSRTCNDSRCATLNCGSRERLSTVPTLYRRLLGDAFDTLPPVLRRFHDQEAGGAACLIFRVSHGKGWLCRGGARIARLPKPEVEARGDLRVVIEGDQERW